ncbi:MAG: nuclear transport factor 2 family protein [Chlamydiales bacterium]|nr:nuclear transport factor 2 family protein [Chlamydiales bacterium]
MNKENVIKAYFKGLEKGHYEETIKLFSANAIVHSPLYGQIEARRFYKELFSDTQSSTITLKNTFISTGNPDTAAAHFIYAWTMKDGTLVQFECVDVFDFIPQSDKILSLTIIYDTYHTRKDFGRVHNT